MNTTAMSKSIQDPYNQTFLLILADGTQTSFSLEDLDYWYLDAIVSCIQYASQLGASFILLVVLFFLTNSGKRTNLLFILNSTALVFNILRMLLICCYFTGPFNEAYNYLSEDFSRLPPSAYGVSIAGTMFAPLLCLVVLASLLMQAQVVCVTFQQKYRQALLISSSIITSGTVASKFYLAAVNIQDILNPTASTVALSDIQKYTNIAMTVTIFWFSAIFVTKLGFALHQRKKLGLRRWGGMQILFTMGCQTLIIPAIFSMLQDFIDFPALGSFELTLVALFLPLSSLWANAAVYDGNAHPGIAFTAHHRLAPGPYITSAQKNKKLSCTFDGSTRCTSDSADPVIETFKDDQELV